MLRHLKILEYAISSLLRRKQKNFSIIIVYAFTVAVLASILFLTHSLKREASLILEGSPSLVVQRIMAGRHDLVPAEYINEIKKIPGVGKVNPRYWGYYYDALTKSNFTLIGIGGVTDNVQMLEGSFPTAAGECAIGAGVAQARFTGVGEDLILINSQNIGQVLEVTGVFEADSSIITNDLIVLGEEDLVRFFGLPAGMATDIAVEVHNDREIDNVAVKIKKKLHDTRPITRKEISRTYDAVFNWRSGMMLTMFLSALITFAILAWDKATGISAEEKREIGILKAIGWDTLDVLTLKLWEGMVVSLSAFLLGLIAAYVHVFIFDASLLARVIKGWSILFPEFRLTPYVDLYQIVIIGFLTVLPYIGSTIVPSWKSAISDPEEIMRG